jgi:hypothetical protein
MRCCVLTVLVLAVLVGVSSPAQAVPILDIGHLEYLEPVGNRYSRGLSGGIVGGTPEFHIVFESAGLSIVGTSGRADFSDDRSDGTIPSFFEGSSFMEPGSEAGSPFGDTTTLSGNRWSCGQPGWWFYCLELVGLSSPGAAVTLDSSEAADPRVSSDQNQAGVDQVAADPEASRQLSAATPFAFIVLTSGLAAAGFAGWRTFLKGRRSSKTGRRRSRS